MGEHDTFTIRESSGRWILRLNGRGLASFDTRAEAERAAFEGLEVSRRSGRSGEALVQFDGAPVEMIAKTAAGLAAPISVRRNRSDDGRT
jgi:hypothetical protein